MAIAHDSTTFSNSARGAGSLTYAHTCTGSDVGLFVGVNWTNANFSAGTITSVTYNGVAMSVLANFAPSANLYTSIWYLNIGTGDASAHDVVITVSSGAFNSIVSGATSLTGVAAVQNGAVDVFGQTTSGTPGGNLTTTQNNSWIYNTLILNDTLAATNPVATGNTTKRWETDSDPTTGNSGVGGTTTTTTAGSNAVSYTCNSIAWKMAVVEVLAAATPTPNSNFFLFMN